MEWLQQDRLPDRRGKENRGIFFNFYLSKCLKTDYNMQLSVADNFWDTADKLRATIAGHMTGRQ
jgi:deferrochelatase/peroxidase EfeB